MIAIGERSRTGVAWVFSAHQGAALPKAELHESKQLISNRNLFHTNRLREAPWMTSWVKLTSSSDHDPLAQPIPNQLSDAQYFSMLGRGVAHYFLASRNLAIT